MKMRYFIIYIVMLICTIPVCSANNVLLRADSAYRAGDYAKAQMLYSGKGVPYNVANLYNLGVAAYRCGDVGVSVVAFRRALKLSPSNDKVKNNLAFVQSKVDDANRAELKGKSGNVSTEEPSFFHAVYHSVARDVHSDTWAVCSIISFLLLIAGVTVYVFTQKIVIRKIGFFGSIILFFCCILFNVFAYMAASEYDSKEDCVVTAYKVNLLSEPGASSKVVSTPLHRGTELRILQHESAGIGNDWYKVRLNSSYIGWVSASDVEVI